jgi:putative membrane protein
MRFLTWLFRVILFILLLSFAVKNDQPVALHYYFGYEWQTSMVVVLLVFFMAGVVVGLLAMLVSLLKHRQEISSLKRELRLKSKLVDAGDTHPLPIQSGEGAVGPDSYEYRI